LQSTGWGWPPNYGDPTHFFLLLRTDTDSNRDIFKSDKRLNDEIFVDATRILPQGFSFTVEVQSQETIDRDYAGSWFYYMK
jgi:hypothetical protein